MLGDRLANYNSKALNAIFKAVDANQFKLISTCEAAKDAWKILETAYQGTSVVKMSKLQLLATQFDNLCMFESETINKKEKSIALQAEVQNSIDEDDADDKEDLTVTLTSLIENFNKIMKKMNRKKNFDKSNNFQKGKAAANLFESKKKSKGIQCHECEGSQEDNKDQVRNYVAFNIVTDYAVTVTMTTATPVVTSGPVLLQHLLSDDGHKE
ncbi:hypothetical protein TIFTF001_017776 [Ficus carica]|uniref:Gag-pol polyprotein n=1 Tax=Ficus carica TaxID=3494 RepID=A0AA88ACW3_FICCA|nr:hypothetical protein TIFTF001_017776 [Ficus carica]